MSAKCGRLNVFIVRVNCSIWDPPTPQENIWLHLTSWGAPHRGLRTRSGWGGGKMENRFFIGNVFLSFWRFSKLCSELRGPLRAEDGKFVFSGSKMFEMFCGGATHPEAQGRWRRVGVKDLKWREPRTALFEISVQLKATSERSRNEAERRNLLIHGTISCYLQSSESVVKSHKSVQVFLLLFSPTLVLSRLLLARVCYPQSSYVAA